MASTYDCIIEYDVVQLPIGDLGQDVQEVTPTSLETIGEDITFLEL